MMKLQDSSNKLDKLQGKAGSAKVHQAKEAVMRALGGARSDSKEKPTTAFDKLSSGQEVGYQGNKIYLNLTETGGYVPVQSISDPKKSGTVEERLNSEITAIQKFDINSPGVREMYRAAADDIDKAIEDKIIKKDPNDPMFVEFCIVTANSHMHKLHPYQNEAANKAVIEQGHANNSTENITEISQADIDTNNAQVCKDFAPTLHILLMRYGIGSKLFATKKHMNLECDIPGKGPTEINAKQNTKELLESEGGQIFQLREALIAA